MTDYKYVQTHSSVIFSNISMIIMYYEYMTKQYFVRFFFIHLKPTVESFYFEMMSALFQFKFYTRMKRYWGEIIFIYRMRKLLFTILR
jgi:hypothetical protein